MENTCINCKSYDHFCEAINDYVNDDIYFHYCINYGSDAKNMSIFCPNFDYVHKNDISQNINLDKIEENLNELNFENTSPRFASDGIINFFLRFLLFVY